MSQTPGTFSWPSTSTLVGNAGTRAHNLNFTPSDTNNFNTASRSVNVEVAKANPTVTWPSGFTVQQETMTIANVTPALPHNGSGSPAGSFSWPGTNMPISNDFAYSGAPQQITLPAGSYRIECWGAQGGDLETAQGGRGGYVRGNITFSSQVTLHVYVGQSGTGLNNTLAFNGGGRGSPANNNHISRAGGGATDVRLVGGIWNNMNSLRSRIMVAAGGGGCWFQVNTNRGSLGHGGGLVGLSGSHDNNSLVVPSNPGTQTSGGIISTFNSGGTSGSFGEGGNGHNSSGAIGGGGGGGYYGGAAGDHRQGFWATNGAGGSSFVSGHPGCNAVTSETSSVHTNQPNHYSGRVFTVTQVLSGNQTMPRHDHATNTMTGNAGHGFCRIVRI